MQGKAHASKVIQYIPIIAFIHIHIIKVSLDIFLCLFSYFHKGPNSFFHSYFLTVNIDELLESENMSEKRDNVLIYQSHSIRLLVYEQLYIDTIIKNVLHQLFQLLRFL